MSKPILVLGATGKQGGALVSALLKAKSDCQILAVTRDTTSGSAQRLIAKSPTIKLVKGDMDAPDGIFRGAKDATNQPIWGVFGVQAAMNHNREEKQGKALVDVALSNGVKHFVYSSVDRGGPLSDQNPTDVPHFATKHNIEQHLQRSVKDTGMTYTILRPVAFFENLVPGFFGKVFTTSWQIFLKPEQKLQLIATSDIGHFAANAFLHPETYKNKALTLVGDELTYPQFETIFKRTIGTALPTTYFFVAKAINWMVKDLGSMFRWFRDVGYGGNVDELRKLHPELKDFATWLREESQFRS